MWDFECVFDFYDIKYELIMVDDLCVYTLFPVY